MAIDPPSDVVLEVAKAADPARAAAATQRLNALGGLSGTQAADFAETLAQTAPSAATTERPIAGLANARAQFADAAYAASDKAAKAKVGFEATLLHGFVEEMLPKDGSSVYGQGLAGDMWKSMLADQVSREIAKSGTLGIAKRLFENRPLSASASIEEPARLDGVSAHATAQASVNDLSLSHGGVYTDGAFLFPGRKHS